MEVQVFIFNYAHFNDALNLFYRFTNAGYDTYLLNCHSPKDPPFHETDKIRKLPNIYYTGQWNESQRYLNADIALYLNADVTIPSIVRLMDRLEKFYKTFKNKAGLYSPNVDYTPWTYNPHLLPEAARGLKVVPGTDSIIWAIRREIVESIGKIDLSVNRLGWGIELVASYYCFLRKQLVVRDYHIKCFHPRHTAYSRDAADREWKNWIRKLNIHNGFWPYYDTKHRYHFGWRGNDDITLKFKNMHL